jgi:hypothetical protein
MGVDAANGCPVDVNGIVVRLRKDSQMPAGYRILTGFPEP